MIETNRRGKDILISLIVWAICIVATLIIVGEYSTLFSLIKIESFLGIIWIGILTGKREGCLAGSIFYLIICGVLICLLANYLTNFIAHYCMQGIDGRYLGESFLRIGSLLCVIICVLIVKQRRIPIHKVFVIVTLFIGCSYMFVMTPISIPDEDYHYKSSYAVSNYILFEDNKTDIPQIYYQLEEQVQYIDQSGAYQIFDDGIIVNNSDLEKLAKIEGHYSLEYPVQHIPQALGISIARLLHLSFSGLFYMGRFTNLAFYILCGYLSIRRIPEFKSAMFVIALMPMSIHQAASYSSDAFINGLSFLLIAIIADIIISEKKVERTDVIKIVAITVLLAPAKVVYLLLAFMVVLISKEYYGGLVKKTGICLLIVGSGFLVVLAFKLNALDSLSSQHTSTDTWCGEQIYSLTDLLANPKMAIEVYLKTFNDMGIVFFETMLGSSLSWLTIGIPRWIIAIIEVVFVLVALANPNESFVFSLKNKVIMFGIAILLILAVCMSMFIGWTPISSDVILGVQGRYFIPIVPLFVFLIRNNTIITKVDYSEYLIATIVFMHFFVLNSVIGVVF